MEGPPFTLRSENYSAERDPQNSHHVSSVITHLANEWRCNAVSASASPSPSSSDWLIVSASRRAPKWRTDRNYEWAQWIWAGRKAGKPPKWIDLSHLKVNLMSVKLVSWKISWHRKTTHQSLNQEFVIMTGEYAHVAQFGFVFFDDDCRRRVFFRRCQ